jgi:hypothetical protein
MPRGSKNISAPLFNDRLILFRYFLSLFGKDNIRSLGETLNHSDYEGFDENQNTKFYVYLEMLCSLSGSASKINKDKLRIYDENICRHVKQIGEKRGIFRLKYFQYLGLLFTEMYLDRYFTGQNSFLIDLNEYIANVNAQSLGLLNIAPYTPDTLNKLGFMCATGSGKTLMMHINILQFLHYYKLARSQNHGMTINKIILLSPNEGMSFQHLEEFHRSSIPASLFQKDGGLDFGKGDVIVIDMNKLKEEGKLKTVSIDSFEQNNLVLVDEAHRGLQGDVWYDYRTRLSQDGGFSFEYSATFKQALKSLKTTPAGEELLNSYGKSIIMDYSYKYFYGDGYGKEYRIYNLQEGIDKGEQRNIYLTGCLLSFYQQVKLYRTYKDSYRAFEIENPLLVFVGNRVTAPVGKNLTKPEEELLTDIEEILVFLDNFVKNKPKTIGHLDKVLYSTTGIVDAKGADLFSQNFSVLSSTAIFGTALTAEIVFEDILKIVFNADTDSPRLHMINLKSQGEIGLRIGDDGGYFGVINIGDTSNLLKRSEAKGITVGNDEFSTSSLFRNINDPNSEIKVLIGSRKFTEGWNCYRVSTMGLINFAKGEGSQAIQLFGRGVRIHGYGGCLKRSDKVDNPPANIPKNLSILETLTIFGIKADYMAEFKKFLELEDLPSNDSSHNYSLYTIDRKDWIKDKNLKVLRVRDGINFKKQAARFVLSVPSQTCSNYMIKNKIVLDCRAKVQAISSPGDYKFDTTANDTERKIQDEYLPYLDYEEIYWQLERYKNEKYYYNISLDINHIKEIVKSSNWSYGLIIPEDELKLNTILKARKATSYMAIVLQSYMDKYYTFRKEEWEDPYLEYQDLGPGDNNFVSEYTFTYKAENEKDTGFEELEQFVNGLNKILQENKGVMKKESKLFSDKLIAFDFPYHLYVPLLYKAGSLFQIQISPISLNEDEKNFVCKLKDFLGKNTVALKCADLYLLRNKSRLGMGFFEAGNFYPDYILWINTPTVQYMTFIDPKGLYHHKKEDPKIQFYKTIKELEQRPRLQATKGDKDIILNSFIITGTGYAELKNSWKIEKEEMTGMHILCLEHQDCIRNMFKKILG